MNQRVAKKLRKKVYGSDYSPRERIYVRDEKTGQIVCTGRRKQYQDLKKLQRVGL